MAWFTAGILTNPAIDTILADTGAVPAAISGVTIILGGNIACVATIEHRNAANNANNASQVIATTAGIATPFYLQGIDVQPGERVRIRLNAAVTGSIQASVIVNG
jgi:hypothetical protein